MTYAHVGGIPLEEMLGLYGPALLLIAGAASASSATVCAGSADARAGGFMMLRQAESADDGCGRTRRLRVGGTRIRGVRRPGPHLGVRRRRHSGYRGLSSEGATALSGDTAGGANAFGPGRSLGPFPTVRAVAGRTLGVTTASRSTPGSLLGVRAADGRRPPARREKFVVLGDGSLPGSSSTATRTKSVGSSTPTSARGAGVSGDPTPPGTSD